MRAAARAQSTLSGQADLLAIPLLDAILADEAAAHWEMGAFLGAPGKVLGALVAHVADRLRSATPVQRVKLVGVQGGLLRVRRDRFVAGNWKTEHLIRQLGHMALNDDDASVRQAAARALGQWENPGTLEALERFLSNAADAAAWVRGLQAIVGYAHGVEAPAAPDARMVEEDGGLTLQIHVTRSTPRRPELYAPVANAAVAAADQSRRAAAIEAAMLYDSGKLALTRSVLQAFDDGRLDAALAVAEETIRQRPEFSSAYWWRGLVREKRGQKDGALADYSRVVELSPVFPDARARRAVLRQLAGDVPGARSDIAQALALAPDDSQIKDIANRLDER